MAQLLITRPRAQAEPWAQNLALKGITSTLLPVLSIVPLQTVDEKQAIKNVVLDFDLYQKAIFVSMNAVEQALDWLNDYWPQLPMGIQYYAVGKTSAQRLAAEGLRVSALTATESGLMNSETLLDTPDLNAVTGEKIVIFRGKGGRGLMAETLRRRGASVDFCELYERRLDPTASDGLKALLEQQALPETIAVHSGDSLLLLLSAAELTGSSLIMQALYQRRLLVPAERVAEQARAAGFSRVIVAENATDEAMTGALLAHINNTF